MKTILKYTYIILLVLVGQTAFAQNSMSDKLKEFVKEDKEPMFSLTQAPEKYKDQSIIVLAKKMRFRFYGSNSMSSSYSYIHTRILLNDLSAIEEFSEYVFDEPSNSNALEIKVIKKSGETILVDLKDAVKEGFEIKTGFRGLNLGEKQNKIAIKNLQIGDIIEYVGIVDRWQRAAYAYGYYMSGGYPVVNTKVMYEYEPNNFVFHWKSLNGAPEFKKDKGAKNFNTFVLQDSMRDAYYEELETKRNLMEPYFKVRVVPAYIASTMDFNYTVGKVRTEITEADFKRAVYRTVKELDGGASAYYFDFVKKFGYDQTDKEYLTKYFYYLRDNLFNSDLAFKGESENVGITMMNKMIKAAQKRDIPFEIALFCDRDEGTFKDVLFEDDIYWGVTFKTSEGDISFNTFNPYSHPNEISRDFEGTEAYYFKVGKSEKSTTLRKVIIPVSDVTQNVWLTDMKASFLNGMDSLLVQQRVDLKGYYRNNEKGKLINRYEFYNAYINQLRDEKILAKKGKYYFFINVYAYRFFDTDFLDKQEESERQIFEKAEYKKLFNHFKRGHQEQSYDLLRYIDYKIINDSRSPGKPNLQWEENLVMGDVSHKINDQTFVFDLGKLVGDMYQINNDRNREERNGQFYISNNRTFTTNISVKIPTGYKVQNLNNLNFNVDNQTGTFTTKAEIVGDEIKLTMTKIYKAGIYDKTIWPQYIQFLDSAVAFTRTSIILTK